MGLLLRGGERGGRRREWEEKGMGEKRKGTKREKGEVRDHHGLQPPKSKFSGYVAANVQLYRKRNRSSRCLHKVSK